MAKIGTVNNDVALELGGKLDRVAEALNTMRGMCAFLIALDIAILIRVLIIR